MAKLLPPNSTQFEINFESAFSRVSDIENPTRKFNDPMTAPSQVLPWLAWEKSVDVWDKNWNEDQKRNAIAASYSVHAHKGTIGALEQAVDALGLNVTIREWFQTVPMLKPYTFEVFIEVSQIGITEPQYKKLIDVVNANKNLRSHWKFANTFVISEAHAEIVNLPICCGHDFEYSKTAGSDIFNIWSDWMIGSNIAIHLGTAHYKSYKSNNDTTLESYANLDLTEAIVRSLYDADMQQWQAVIDSINQLTGVSLWQFDLDNQWITYEKSDVPQYTFRAQINSHTLIGNTLDDVCAQVNPTYMKDYGFLFWQLTGIDYVLLQCKIGKDPYTTANTVPVSKIVNPNYNVTTHHLDFTTIAEKIISNASSSHEAISLLAEIYLENIAQSIFNSDESKQFVKLSDLIDQFEENKI